MKPEDRIEYIINGGFLFKNINEDLCNIPVDNSFFNKELIERAIINEVDLSEINNAAILLLEHLNSY